MPRKSLENVASVLVTGTLGYLRAMDRVMLATGHSSRSRLIETALHEYAKARGFKMPLRLESDSRYFHAEE